jgi:hypothetical protein
MAKKNETLTLNNAPKAKSKSDDTVDITEQQKAAEKLSAELAALEEQVKKAVPQTAADKLGEFRLTHLAKALLDKACVNVSENVGTGLEDPVAKDTAATIAGIFNDCGCDLSKVIDFTMEAMQDDPKDALTFIYKECYSVQKALNFIGNMAYRRALDPKSDFDLDQFVDYREEERPAPFGLDPIGTWDDERHTDHEDGIVRDASLGNERDRAKDDHELIIDALEDLHVYLQLITEAYGWEPVDSAGRDNSMPYMYVMEKDETFRRIYGLEECLDIMEVKYKEARAKRAAKQLEGLRKIQQAARMALKKAAK